MALSQSILDEEVKKRWRSYSTAMQDFPHVREEEIVRTAQLVDPQPRDRIIEIGTGSGALTWLLAKALIEMSDEGWIRTLDCHNEKHPQIEAWHRNQVHTGKHCSHSDTPLEMMDGIMDKVVTLATFHHYDTRSTGVSGRHKLLKQIYDALKPGGRLTLVDVAKGTRTQRYFDAIDNPRHCYPVGHPHDFIDKPLMERLCDEAGLTDMNYQIIQTPWRFGSEEQARMFLHKLHNAQCTPEESFALAKEYLGWQASPKSSRTTDVYELGWELAFVQARKPE